MRVAKKKHYILITLLFLYPALFPANLISEEYSSEATVEEALFVRRILEFWRDRENGIVKSQIQEFITTYPQSEYKDSLLVILGDAYWNEKAYESALQVYKMISKFTYQDKVFNNRLDCLFHLGHYQEIQNILQGKITETIDITNEQEVLWTYYKAETFLNLAKQKTDSDERTFELEQAKSHFLKLLNSEHKVNAKLALAEIESLKGNAELVVQYYIELANDSPEKQNEMLWRAAQLQAQYDPEKALVELEKIQKVYGKFSSEAALSQLAILYDLKRYQQILDNEQEFFKALKSSQQPILHLYVGRSYFYLHHYVEALSNLEMLLKPESSLPNHDPYIEKSIYIMMAASAYHLHNLNLILLLRQKFQNQFSNDSALAEMLYYEAMTLTHFQKYQEALNDLDLILTQFPQYELKDNVQYEKSVILYKQGQWEASRKGFAELIKIDSESKLKLSALQYMPCLAMHLLEEAEKNQSNNSKDYREILHNDLKSLLKFSDDLDEVQKSKYVLQLGKIQYELKQYQEAIVTLTHFIENNSNDDHLFQGHLLMALCYHEGMGDQAKFASHAETVLKINPDFADQSQLHMNLFNAYLELAKNSDSNEIYLDQAADHLFMALKDQKETIKQENLLWLANFFYHKIRLVKQDYETEPLTSHELKSWAKKALAVYQIALNDSKKTDLDKDNLYLEIEYYKKSNLYGWLGQIQEQKNLLAFLIQAQYKQPSLNWKLRSRVLFSYANVNALLNEKEEAMKKYLSLFTSKKSTDSYIVNSSKLNWARLAFKALPSSKHLIDDPDMMAILKTLKDVQIHKLLLQEPIHLEAGLDYAELRASIEENEKQIEQHLFLLKRMKEDFTTRDDMWSKEYLESRQQHPDKNTIFEAYMNLVEAHINRLQAQLEDKKNNQLAAEYREAAKILYQRLISDDYSVSKYLIHQAKSGLQQIE